MRAAAEVFVTTLGENVSEEDLVAVAVVNGHVGPVVLLAQSLGAGRVHFDEVVMGEARLD